LKLKTMLGTDVSWLNLKNEREGQAAK